MQPIMPITTGIQLATADEVEPEDIKERIDGWSPEERAEKIDSYDPD